ncbi:MAG: hypothetical protein AB1630_11040 [bacterium]
MIIKAELNMEFIFLKRYPLETITSFCIVFLLFMGMFFGAKMMVGKDLVPCPIKEV